jgi:CBS domain containing-hemolysin-like protein
MEILITVLIMLVCLIAEGFFSGSEIGVISADRMKLRHEAAKGSEGARLALEMLKKPEWLLSTTLVGTNIAVVTNTTMATALMMQLFGPSYSWLAIVLVAPLIWVFGEIVPKSIFQQRANVITPRAIFVLKFCSYLFYPILLVFSFLARLMARMLGDKKNNINPFTLREEIKSMMQMSASEGDIEPIEQKMIHRLFNFGETTAREVMMPLIDVTAIEQGVNCGRAIEVATERSHARIPVYSERVDKIIGMLDTLELLGVDADTPISRFIKPISYAAPTKSIHDLLLDMRQKGEQMTVVVDEYGGAQGIVSIEDILEEVVEDLQDEYDAGEAATEWVRKIDDRTYLVCARIDLDDLAEKLDIELPKGRYASLAGFLLDKAQEVPAEGSELEYKDIVFSIHRATPQVIQEVKVFL